MFVMTTNHGVKINMLTAQIGILPDSVENQDRSWDTMNIFMFQTSLKLEIYNMALNV